MDYLTFLYRNRRFLGFGLLATALSGFGQTFYIALFGGELRAAFDLSHGEYGLLYSLATLASGIAIVWAGRQIDRFHLPHFVAVVGLGVVFGCLLLASAVSAPLLLLAMFVLRLCGQGLLTHTAATSMGRYFQVDRGKAVSIAAKGLPLAEAVMPVVGVTLVALYGWRVTWFLSAAAMALVFMPLLLWLLRGHGARHRAYTERLNRPSPDDADGGRHWNRGEVLRDRRFHLLLPAVLAGPLIVTGMFFHQAHLAATKGWSLEWLAASFTGFAGAHVVGLLVFGPILDELGARRLVRFFLAPMAMGLLLVAAWDHPAVAWGYMVLMGISIGGTGTLLGALWPELYGVTHLGAIRSLVQAAMVFATAVTPAGVGLLVDAGFTMEHVALALVGYIGIAVILAARALREETGGTSG